MKKGEHTPGPWNVEHTPGPWNVEHDTEIIAAEGQRIAEADTRSINFVSGEATANAYLIAAAPDLLAACELAVNAGLLHASDAERIRNAIEKARGGT